MRAIAGKSLRQLAAAGSTAAVGAVAVAVLSVAVPAAAGGRVFTGAGLTADGGGYLLSSTIGHMYAFGAARAVNNPARFSGSIADVAVTADGRGAMAVSTTGQFYAYGTVQAQPNPRGFTGEITAVAVTADGRGAMAVSSAGQFYAYGTARPQINPTGFSGRIVDVALTADGRGAMAVSSAGQFYAYGTARAQTNPTGFTGQIVGLDITADEQGALALSSAGQFYAYGTARAQTNVTGANGQMVAVDMTANGSAAIALSSTGQVHARGVGHRGNGDWGCERYGGADVCLDIRARYEALGGAGGTLGIPTSHEFSAGGGRGLGMHFQGGSIYWSPATGAWDVRGVIRDKYFASGAENSVLGFPKSGEFPASGGMARGTHFTGGSIYWSPATGAKAVNGDIRRVWESERWENGRLGLPVTDELRGYARVSRLSFFVGGSIATGPSGTRAYPLSETADALSEALTLDNMSRTDFMSLQRVRSTKQEKPLNWMNNGCSGPTYGDVDSTFREACLRHDFGARNFGPHGHGLDPSGDRLDKVNVTFEQDMKESCKKKGNPRLQNNGLWISKSRPLGLSCSEGVAVVYQAVRLTATGAASPWKWW